MYEEPSATEVIAVAILHMWTTGASAISHHAVYFMLGVTFWAIHFAHYFFLFTTMLISCTFKWTEFKLIPIMEMLPVCLSQFVVSTATCLVHYTGSNGALFAQRLTDGIVVILVVLGHAYFIHTKMWTMPQTKLLLISLAVFSSLGWLEGVINFRLSYLFLLPLLDAASAFHFLITNHKFQKLEVPINTYILNVSGLTSLLLLPTAVCFTTDGVTKEWYNTKTVFELSDVWVFILSYISYAATIYTKYWLMCKCTQETFLFIRHAKYHVANYGQLVLRNFTYTPISIIARPIATTLMLIYIRKRFIFYKKHSISIVENGV